MKNRTSNQTSNRISPNKCSVCGARAKKTTICITVWIAEADYDIYQCSNENCNWHVQPHFYAPRAEIFNSIKANRRPCNYIDDMVHAYDSGNYDQYTQHDGWDGGRNDRFCSFYVE